MTSDETFHLGLINGMVGTECFLYFDGLDPKFAGEEAEVIVDCTLGQHWSRFWKYRPKETDIGEHALTIRFDSGFLKRRVTAQGTLVVRAETPGASRTWLPVGDSITASGRYIRKVIERGARSGLPIVTLGTREIAEMDGLRHEGYPGWKFIDFLNPRPELAAANPRETIKSPFLFGDKHPGVLDVERYLGLISDHTEPDVITFFLGTNDIALLHEENLERGIRESLEAGRTLVSALLAATRRSRIGLMAPLPPSASQDSFGIDYGCLIPRWRYCRNQYAMLCAMMKAFSDFDPRVSLIPAYLQIDPVHGYPTRLEKSNPYTEHATSVVCNSVHPADAGYSQIADAVYAWMRSLD